MSNRGRRWPPVRSRRNSFLLYALGCIGTFAMASRAVHWFDGPPWLGLAFAVIGLVLAGYYLVRALLDWRRSAAGRR